MKADDNILITNEFASMNDAAFLDFYAHAVKIIVEVDGSQHYSEEGIERDKKRDNDLAELGFTVLRFNNVVVLQNINGVVFKILEFIEKGNTPQWGCSKSQFSLGVMPACSPFKTYGDKL